MDWQTNTFEDHEGEHFRQKGNIGNGAKSLPEQGFNWRAKCKSFPWENNSKDLKNKQP